jgi:hypothetical protein
MYLAAELAARTPGFEPFPNIFLRQNRIRLNAKKMDNAVLTLSAPIPPAEDASSQPGCSAQFRQTTITL